MNFNNVKLLFGREMRDQLRDRRTLFMIAVLPLLFYPLLGFSFFQIAQFLQEEPSRILVVGYEGVQGLPNLFHDGKFDASILGDKKKSEQFQLVKPGSDGIPSGPLSMADMKRLVEQGNVQAVVFFPAEFAQRLEEYRAALREHTFGHWPAGKALPQVPEPQIIYDDRQEKSANAGHGTENVLQSWTEAIGRTTLVDNNMPATAASPINIRHESLSATGEDRNDTSLWSKVLPFVLLIWAVTGAFYPAVDLCAGEKERGTLETLLASPAQRSEIVMGKLLTVMLFSMATAILNLVSMGITGGVVMSHLRGLPMVANVGVPPLGALGWLIIALVPVSALFSAVCLALAAFARSTKEGQYYLMPVILITMPLILLPMAPSAELNLGYSLVPISGIVLLMRSTMEGTIGRLWPYAIPVFAVTLACCWLAIRWAIDQFNSESVLFREGERWDLSTWMAHMMRDRQPTPSVAMAVMCGALILVICFFGSFVMPMPLTFLDFFRQQFVRELAMIATPALLMAIVLTRSPARTLLLSFPLKLRSFSSLLAAAALAVLLHPLIMTLQATVQWLYPLNNEFIEFNEKIVGIISGGPNIWVTLLIIAVVPALCEELAFRGFILSGFRHLGHKYRAVVFSALLFGFSHGILQQSILAALTGCVIGYIAVQTGSLWPGVVYHIVHNALAYVVGFIHKGNLAGTRFDWLQSQLTDGSHIYRPMVVVAGIVGAALILVWLGRFPYHHSREETIQEAIEQEAVHSMAG